MPLQDTTLDAMSDSLAEAFGSMTDEDRAKLQARLAERLGADVDVLTAASEPEAVGASGDRLRRMAARQGKAAPSPESAISDTRGRTTLVAAGGLYGVAEGTVLTDRRTLATAMAETLKRMHREAPAKGRVIVASAETQYPENRQLSENAEDNFWKMEGVAGVQALVATGGICLPVNVDYAVPTWATADRPLRDSLPAYQATRGGLRYVKPPDIAEWAAASTVWSAATDAAPGVETKPIVSITCGSEELSYVNAIPTRIGYGNMQSRFAPEQVASNVDLAIAAAARTAENELLTLIAAASVKEVACGEKELLGSTRELLTAIGQVASQQRQLHRLPDSLMITAVLPRWVREEIRIDLAREQAHAQSDQWNSLAVTDAQIEALFTSRGVRPVFHLDGQTEGGVSQLFVAPAAKGAIKKYPTKVTFYMYPEGTMQFLDAGRLDLGVVRDSTLDATNDAEIFVETFEGIAPRGYASASLQLVCELAATGVSAATIAANKAPA
jgi:hypothetical protein